MYPNHGEATVKIHYEGDTLVAVKVGLERPAPLSPSAPLTAFSSPPRLTAFSSPLA